jgi:1-acyl-sn-glycerol-3-phosphate acyltransferase
MESVLPLLEPHDPRPTVTEIWQQPLPGFSSGTGRLLCRLITTLARRHVTELRGLDHVAPEKDPFILVSNHNSRLDALLLPTLLLFHRRGDPIRFLADWPMMLVPGVGLLYRHARVILVGAKSARFRVLNRFRDRILAGAGDAFEQCRATLREGGSLGFFPEATLNRHPERLLRGQTGAARLALATSTPIVPVGIRFPEHPPGRAIGDLEPMTIEFGPPIEARPAEPRSALAAVRELHAQLMQEIARLSGKRWSPRAPRRRDRDAGL